MTNRLYENDSYCRKFSAVVESCEYKDGKYIVVLDKTAFFPEGGGQAADKGIINGICVTDVQRRGDVILHTLDSEVKAGEVAECEIDWKLRYSRMQSHSGEHILSGIVHNLFGYNNVGFHMSDAFMQVDFDGALSAEDIEKIEIEANEAVHKNAEITAYYPTAEEIEKIDYRSKIELSEDIRIVSIGDGIDCCACCAPHVARTGEIGIIKISDAYSYKQGTRIEMIAGINALRDYMSLNASNKKLMKILSAPREGVVDAVDEKISAYQDLKNEYQKILKRLSFLELNPVEVGTSAYAIADNLSYDELRHCSNQLLDGKYDTCILLSKNENGGYIYVVSSKICDVRPMVKELNEAFSGKGGGQSGYAQGKIDLFPEEDIKKFAESMLGK